MPAAARGILRRFMIDRRLNFGRESVAQLCADCRDVRDALDLGAGRGEDLESVRRAHPGARLSAVEVCPPAVKHLQDRDVTVYQLDLERQPLPIADESLDLIIANQFLEHVKEIFWIVHEATRTLRTGGHLLIGVPNLASLHNRLLLLFGRQPTSIRVASAHVRGYTTHGVIAFLHDCAPGSYTLAARRGANFYPFPPLLARPLARFLPAMAWSTFMLLRKERACGDEFRTFPLRAGLQTNYFTGEPATAWSADAPG